MIFKYYTNFLIYTPPFLDYIFWNYDCGLVIHNAKSLMKEHEEAALGHNASSCCYKKSNQGTMLPEKNMVQCNKKTCQFYENDYEGIGTGRNYASF